MRAADHGAGELGVGGGEEHTLSVIESKGCRARRQPAAELACGHWDASAASLPGPLLPLKGTALECTIETLHGTSSPVVCTCK